VNVALKQRIIGALVLVALAAIFLPVALNFSDPRVVDKTSQIPPAPAIDVVETPEPARVEGVSPARKDSEIFQSGVDQPQQAEALDEEPSGLTAEGIPKGWLIQVGGFRERQKAEQLVSSLQKDGYKAYLRSGSSKQGILHRVFVGPKIEKRRAIAEKADIDKKYGVDSLIVRFEP
jgi:DedD protein